MIIDETTVDHRLETTVSTINYFVFAVAPLLSALRQVEHADYVID